MSEAVLLLAGWESLQGEQEGPGGPLQITAQQANLPEGGWRQGEGVTAGELEGFLAELFGSLQQVQEAVGSREEEDDASQDRAGGGVEGAGAPRRLEVLDGGQELAALPALVELGEEEDAPVQVDQVVLGIEMQLAELRQELASEQRHGIRLAQHEGLTGHHVEAPGPPKLPPRLGAQLGRPLGIGGPRELERHQPEEVVGVRVQVLLPADGAGLEALAQVVGHLIEVAGAGPDQAVQGRQHVAAGIAGILPELHVGVDRPAVEVPAQGAPRGHVAVQRAALAAPPLHGVLNAEDDQGHRGHRQGRAGE